jgi:hypothetical protein
MANVDCQRKAKRPRALEEDRSKGGAQFSQVAGACIIPSPFTNLIASKINQKTIAGYSGSTSNTLKQIEQEEALGLDAIPLGDLSVETCAASTIPESASIQQEEAMALDGIMAGDLLVAKLLQPGNVLWQANISPEQNIKTKKVRSAVVRTPEAADSPNILSNKESDTIEEQAIQEKWEQTVRALRTAVGTCTLCALCFHYLFFTHVSILELQLLADGSAESTQYFNAVSVSNESIFFPDNRTAPSKPDNNNTLAADKMDMFFLTLFMMMNKFEAINFTTRPWRMLFQRVATFYPLLAG